MTATVADITAAVADMTAALAVAIVEVAKFMYHSHIRRVENSDDDELVITRVQILQEQVSRMCGIGNGFQHFKMQCIETAIL